MKYCSNCGEKIDFNSKFCNFCGIKINKETEQNVNEDIIEKEQKLVNNNTNNDSPKKEENITERKTVYDGYIHKCPSCGEILKSFMVNCPACGYELRGTKATNSVSELVKKIEIIESEREYGKDNILKSLNLDMTLSKTDEQKISLIRNFIIPNTKEDLYEFLILSKSNIEIDLYENTQMRNARLAVSDAWRAKFEQAYQKAKLLFKNDDRMVEIQSMYDEVNKSIDKAKWKTWKIMGIVFGVIILMYVFIFGMIALTVGFDSDDNTSNNSDSNNNSSIINEDISDKDNENDNNEEKNETDEISSGSFNEKSAIKNLKVKEYKTESYSSSGMVLVIENNNDYDIHLKANIEFYDKNNELIGVAEDSIAILDKKTTSLMSFWNEEDFETVKYEFTASENEYYKAGISDISFTSKSVKNKEIVSVTNKGKDKIAFLEGYVLFFEDDNLVEIESTYFDNNGYYLEPGKTVSKELECYGCDYDSTQIYFTGRVEK